MGLWGRGNAGNLCFDTWCRVYMISSTAVDRTCATLCCQRDNAYTNSNHAKPFLLLATNGHNPNHSLATKPRNTTGLMFSANAPRLVWSFFLFASKVQTGPPCLATCSRSPFCLFEDNACEFPPLDPSTQSIQESHAHTATGWTAVKLPVAQLFLKSW